MRQYGSSQVGDCHLLDCGMTQLLRSNSELRAHNIWNWTLPAWFVRLDDGIFKTCPNAGVCAQMCYARNGAYLFSNVKAAHLRNLMLVRDEPKRFMSEMSKELSKPRFRPSGIARTFDTAHKLVSDEWATNWIANGGAAIRIHDSGDFFSRDYLRLWLFIAGDHPDILFYAYTKEVEMLKGILPPPNFRIIYSKGGLQDHLIDNDLDRHADVFPSVEALEAAGYLDQEENDLLAVLLDTTRIGIVANNIKRFRKKQGEQTFAQLAQAKSNK